MTHNVSKKEDCRHITPDECIDFAGGLLAPEDRRQILLHTAGCRECEQSLKAVMTQAELGRIAAEERERSSVRDAETARRRQHASWLETIRGWFSVPVTLSGQRIPIPVTAVILAVGILVGAGSMQVFSPSAETPAGAPTRLLSLFPVANRTVGVPAVDPGASHLYLELNEVDASGTDAIPFEFSGPDGAILIRGDLTRNRETGEWAGLYLHGDLLSEPGRYELSLSPAPDGTAERFYSFIIANRS